MPHTTQKSTRLASVVAAFAITLVIQGAVLKGFEQMASESPTAVAAAHAASPTAVLSAAAATHTPG
jgi:hypothetical protein